MSKQEHSGIENSHSTDKATVTGTSSVGGICGKNNGTLQKRDNAGAVTGTGNGIGGVCGENRGTVQKRIQGASFVKFQKNGETLFSSYYRKIRLCTHRIVCIQCNALQPLSSYSGVQKVCKNVQTGKTKPNGQINHRFYGRV